MQIGGKAPGRGVRGSELALGLALGQGIHVEPPLSDLERRFDGVTGTRRVGRRPAKAVLHHLQYVAAARVKAGVALPLQQGFDLGGGEIRRYRHREAEQQTRIAGCPRARLEGVADALGGVAAHRPATAPAMQHRGAREQQLQMVVELGHGADRGTRAFDGIVLIDGDRRGNALDTVDSRPIHAVQELARVGREGLEVAALSLGVQGVEHQR